MLSVIWAISVFFLERPDEEYRKYRVAQAFLASDAGQITKAEVSPPWVRYADAITTSEKAIADRAESLVESGMSPDELTQQQRAAIAKLKKARQSAIAQARARQAEEEALSAVDEAKTQFRRSSSNMQTYAFDTLVPIALTLAIGAALAWVLRGFREAKRGNS